MPRVWSRSRKPTGIHGSGWCKLGLFPWMQLSLTSAAFGFIFERNVNPRPGQREQRPDLVQLLLGHVGLALGAQGPEGALDLLAGLDILRFSADHESHVLLQGDVPVPGEGQGQ